MKVKVIFFEAGIGGGSVNRLLNILRQWDYTDIPCSLITFFNKSKSAQFKDLIGPAWVKSFALPGEKQPDSFVKISACFFPTLHGIHYFLKSLFVFTSNPKALAYINNTPYAHLPVIIAATLTRNKVICHLRSMNVLTRLEKVMISAVDKFIVLTCAAKDHYIRQGIPEHKIEVIYDSIDLSRFARAESRREGEDASTAIVVGSLFFLKGQDVCLKALPLVREKHPHVRLTLVGEGYYENDLRLLARSLGIEYSVAFKGYSDRISELLQKHGIGILTSRKEGMPNCVQEYMATGLPVIVADLPGIRELVAEGESGFIVSQESPEELARAWITLLEDDYLRHRMGKRGRMIMEEQRFTPEQEIKRIVETIKSTSLKKCNMLKLKM